MIVGIPKEIKTNENRISMTPLGVKELTQRGHRVLLEQGAGRGSGFLDNQYQDAGAVVASSASDVWEEAEMIIKVKEPTQSEYTYFREELIIFTYLHLASNRPLTENLLKKKAIGVAYETVQLSDGTLPLLKPMSEIAGRVAAQEAANLLVKHRGGKGLLIGGGAGVAPARVVILGGGVSGMSAASVCIGMGAHVTILDVNLEKLKYLEQVFNGNCVTACSTIENIQMYLASADIVFGCVLVPGAKSPHLVTKDMLKLMEPGTVLVDIAIDQGGCFETSRPTTHENPTYILDGIIHYCVTNIPGAVPKTSTQALSNATLPYVRRISDLGFERAIKADQALRKGVNTFRGALTNEKVALAFGMRHTALYKWGEERWTK